MKTRPPRPPLEWNTLIAAPWPTAAAADLPQQAAVTVDMEHLDYNHHALKIGPLDHLSLLVDTERFAVR